MKRYFIYAVIIAAFAFAIPACQKQLVQEDDITITDTIPSKDETIYADPLPVSTGLIVGKIMPETKFGLVLYNDQYTYTEYDIMNRTGAFAMKGIKAGEYTLLIEPYDPSVAPFEITRIVVDSGRTKNLGLIFLP